MFTGIVESTGILKAIVDEGKNRSYIVESSISYALQEDQSVAHDGVCLTVTEVKNNQHRVTAVAETLSKTNLKHWQHGREINLERAMRLDDRLDGHLVQGHVDSTGICIGKNLSEDNCILRFKFPQPFAALVIEKGSITVNGISLTAFDVEQNQFSVTIIPYTLSHTSIKNVAEGAVVNLEYDLIGKYLQRQIELGK